ncbi:MAG TPA: DUF3611 family protein [Coleofasciculaceae cyanobacterium]|jgi:hypothetical protein
MTRQSDSYSIPPAVKRVAGAFWLTGWASFWVQIILAFVSALVLLFAASGLGATSAVQPGTQGIPGQTPIASAETGIGLLLAILGLLCLFAGAFWAFRYTRLARKLKTPDAQSRPKRGDVVQALRIGLFVNLIGMLLTIFGAQAIVGSLVGKSFSQGFAVFSGNSLRFITPLDIFLVQSNTNTIMAHFVGLIATLWLLQCMNRQ